MDKVQETQNAHSHSHNRSCSHNHNLDQEESSNNHPGGGNHNHSHSHSAAAASIQSPSPPGSSSASSSSIGSSFTSSLSPSNDHHHHQHYSIPILTSSTHPSHHKSQAEINTSESGNQDILKLANSTMQFHNPFANVNSGSSSTGQTHASTSTQTGSPLFQIRYPSLNIDPQSSNNQIRRAEQPPFQHIESSNSASQSPFSNYLFPTTMIGTGDLSSSSSPSQPNTSFGVDHEVISVGNRVQEALRSSGQTLSNSRWNGFNSPPSTSSLQSRRRGVVPTFPSPLGPGHSRHAAGTGPSPLSSPKTRSSTAARGPFGPVSPPSSKFSPEKQKWKASDNASSSSSSSKTTEGGPSGLFSPSLHLHSHQLELEAMGELASQRRASTGTGYVPAGDGIDAYRDLERDEVLNRKRRRGGIVSDGNQSIELGTSSTSETLSPLESTASVQTEDTGPHLLSLRTPTAQSTPRAAAAINSTSSHSRLTPTSASTSSPTSTSPATTPEFQLQPVPASKRRKTSHRNQDFKTQASSVEIRKAEAQVEEVLMRCDDVASEVKVRADLKPSIGSKSQVSSHQDQPTEPTQPRVKSLHAIAAAAPPPIVEKDQSKHSDTHRRIPRPRLRRSQSVPPLRARTAYDLSLPVGHRLALPSHLAAYLAASQRTTTFNLNSSNTSSHKNSSSRGHSRQVTSTYLESSRQIYTPSLYPPFTRHTLRELDLAEILQNPQLRHDVVFDPNVQFRQNFDGDRGGRKREAGDRYWTSIAREIELGCTCTRFEGTRTLECECGSEEQVNRDGSKKLKSKKPSRIPLLVHELRAICLLILPSHLPSEALLLSQSSSDSRLKASSPYYGGLSTPTSSIPPLSPAPVFSPSTSSPNWSASHHQLIATTLDPHLISQEIAHGVLDVEILIKFLAEMLKLHCAPLRDEAIEKMVNVVCQEGKVAKGLRMCFEILELMKLDIANHQLRSTRPFLVDTAVEFETLWFREQLESGKVNLDRTFFWFDSNFQKVRSSGNPPSTRTEAISRAFYSGYLDLVFEAPQPIKSSSVSSASTSSKLGRTSGPSPSSSSLNNLFSSCYPETFQFDSYRLVTFNNDVVDLTIMYMLLLLFRQLACSPQLLSKGQSITVDSDASKAYLQLTPSVVSSNAASIAQRQLESVKSEIWCLVSDAALRLSSKSASTNEEGTIKSSSGHLAGSEKLENTQWREGMQDVLLQIAVRAAAVQVEARGPSSKTSSEPSNLKGRIDQFAPSPSTVKLLNSWLDNNLRLKAPLYLLCQSRLRTVVQYFMMDRLSGVVSNSSRPRKILTSPSTATPGSISSPLSPAPTSTAGSVRKQMEDDQQSTSSSNDFKRIKLSNGTIASSASTSEPRSLPLPRPTFSSRGIDSKPSSSSISRPRPHPIRPIGHTSPLPSKSPLTPSSPRTPISPALAREREQAILVKNGLEPFTAEIRLLADRVSKVAAFHLRVYRSIYEGRASQSDPLIKSRSIL